MNVSRLKALQTDKGKLSCFLLHSQKARQLAFAANLEDEERQRRHPPEALPNAVDRAKMNLQLATLLPRLLPLAIEWAEARSWETLETGRPLSDNGIRLARAGGVVHPDKIRVSIVTTLPLPDDHELRSAALSAGLLGPGMVGLTLGYAIYICDGHCSSRLLSHECRHVYQYECAGSISNFLPQYLQQIAIFGYENAPYEVDARNHEIESLPG